MTEIEALMTLIKRLPEVDVASLFEQLNEHVNDRNWGHIVKKAFAESISDLEDKIEELQDQIDSMESKRDDYAGVISNCIQLIEEDEGNDPANLVIALSLILKE